MEHQKIYDLIICNGTVHNQEHCNGGDMGK